MKKYIFKSLIIGISYFLCPSVFSQSITLVSAASTVDQTVCVNTQITEIKYDLSNDITSATVESLPNGVTYDFNSTLHVLTINGIPDASGNYTFYISTSGGANSLTASGTLNVEELNLPQAFDSFKCSNETINFYFPSNANYIWSKTGNGTFINNNGSNPGYTPSKNDEGSTVTITVSLTNSCGNDSKNFNYSILKVPSFTGNLTTNPGATVQLTGSETTGYNWISSSIDTATISSTGLVTGVGKGKTTITYELTHSINSGNSSTTCQYSQILSVVQLVIPTIAGNHIICRGSSTQLTGSESPAINNSWVSSNSAVASVSSTGEVFGITNGNSTITYTNSTNGSTTFEVTINGPTVSAGSDQTVCQGSSVTLNASGGATQFTWNNSVIDGISFIPNLGSTSYTVTTTDNNCSASDDVVITVNEKPNLVINNPAPVCEPNKVDITTSAITSGSTGNGNLTYWTDIACLYSLGSPNSIINSGPIFIKSTLGECFDIKPVTVIINPSPNITNPGNITVCDSLILPSIIGTNLSGNEKYYNNSKANNGAEITKPIKSDQTVWIYDESGACSSETSFEIKIIKTPKLTSPGNQTVCDSYNLPIITGLNLTGHQKYYNKSQAENGIEITGPITNTLNVWIYDSIKACANEIDFLVTVIGTPNLVITNPSPVDAPTSIDITSASVTLGSTGNGTLSYWINPEASIPLTSPKKIDMSGTYYIKSIVGNCSDTNFVTVTINKNDKPTKLLSAYVIPTGVTQNGLCDGKAEVVITSGVAPYTFLFSDNSTSSSSLNLCPGLKSVRVTDANKDTLNLNFIIASPQNVTYTLNLKDSVVVNKIYNKVVSNCIIDYSKINSAKINNYKILSADSIEIEWKIYSELSVISVTNRYSIGTISKSGVYQFSLQIYCQNKAMGNFLTAYDQMYINIDEIDISSGLGIQEKGINDFLIYPNPFNNSLKISIGNEKTSEITISDNSGKIMKSLVTNESEVTIDTEYLLQGFYTLKIKNGDTIKSIKLLK